MVQRAPIVARPDLYVPSSCESHWMMLCELRAQSSPTTVNVGSEIKTPSSNTRFPNRTPISRHSTLLNGVPSNRCMKVIGCSFHTRSTHQKPRS